MSDKFNFCDFVLLDESEQDEITLGLADEVIKGTSSVDFDAVSRRAIANEFKLLFINYCLRQRQLEQ